MRHSIVITIFVYIVIYINLYIAIAKFGILLSSLHNTK